VPWRNRVLFGTWESDAGANDAAVTEADIAAFIDEINQAFPSGELTRAGVTLVHRGLVPRHDRIDDRADGLITVAGAKYTTARAVAERVADLVFAKLGRAAVPCRTGSTPLPFRSSVELVEAVRDEMVVTLADAVIRRTPMGALGCPDEAELTRAATTVGGELGWSPERIQQEIAGVRRFYSPLAAS
jgi:glycerol-3-phosphate dehydrogenase